MRLRLIALFEKVNDLSSIPKINKRKTTEVHF